MDVATALESGGRSAAEQWDMLRARLRRAGGALRLGGALGLADLRSGHWFDRLEELYLAWRERHPAPSEAARREADDVIRRAGIEAALLGSGSALLATTAVMATAETDGLAGVVAVPAAAVGLGCDMVARALVQFGMAADLAELDGTPFRVHDRIELTQLFALALGLVRRAEGRAGRGGDLVEQLVAMEPRAAGAAIGSKLATETLLRSVLPVVDLVTSSVASWQLTQRLGRLCRRYLRGRRALMAARLALTGRTDEATDALVEGAWFVFTAAEPLTPARAALLAHQLRPRGPRERDRLLRRLAANDENAFHARLRGLDFGARLPLLRALEMAAAVEGATRGPHRAVLHRAADAMEMLFDAAELEAIERRLSEGVAAAGSGAAFPEATPAGPPAEP